jgi:hypothetical protein
MTGILCANLILGEINTYVERSSEVLPSISFPIIH